MKLNEAQAQLGRFLRLQHWQFKTADIESRYVEMLMKSDFLVKGTLESLNPLYHAKFHQLLDHCKQIAQSGELKDDSTLDAGVLDAGVLGEFYYNELKAREDELSVREQRYLELVDEMLDILKKNKIPIPLDVDDFILKLATLKNFRINICKRFPKEDYLSVESLCKLLLDNEKGID